MKQKHIPEINKPYTYSEVAELYDDPVCNVHYVIVNEGRIVALRLREDYNLKIQETPGQVWVGNTPAVKAWGDVLATQRANYRLDVFVKGKSQQKYTYLGEYRRNDKRQAKETEIAHARASVPHKQGVSRVVFLDKI